MVWDSWGWGLRFVGLGFRFRVEQQFGHVVPPVEHLFSVLGVRVQGFGGRV